jgi:phenylalanyl-tRNA synthetase beta chain
MQISFKWINELVDIETVELDNLVEKLTLGGFEVEEILELEVNNQKQIVLDISATANRSDSLSSQGISLEIAALLNKPIKVSNYLFKVEDWKHNINTLTKTISPESNCSIFLSVIVKNLTNITIPKWLTEKLITSGQIPWNNLLDFQNYILLETGYPFAFYDYEKLISKLKSSEFNLSISKAETNQEFDANNGIKYHLDNSTLLIKANEIPLSIAGIIENKEFSYSRNTSSLLIEGSIFNAAKIRQQSRSLGLRTNRSARYEKSLKKTYIIESLYRLISLLRVANPNLTCELHTSLEVNEPISKPILLRYETINEILGPIKENKQNNFKNIHPEKISDYLERLNFKFLYDESKLSWEVKIQDSRTDDLTREIDLIEEIGRLHGFNNFLTTLPKIKTIGKEDSSYITRKKITACLLNLGFYELIHYSLVHENTFLNNEIKLVNPLLADCSSLRSSLLPSLIKTVQENLKQGNLFIEGFEYGHIFLSDLQTNFKEREYVAGIFGGIKTKLTWSDCDKALTWFEAKGKIEQVFKQLNLSTYWQNCSIQYNDNILHPYRTAGIYFQNGICLGVFGQINPILANQLNISPSIYLFEFDVELIQNQIQRNKLKLYKDYSLYPKITKDLSFIIGRDITFKELQKTLYCNGTEFLSEITLLDEYRGQSIPDGYTSLCLQLVFQSNEKTLQNKEIENIIKKLQLILNQKFNAVIRE